MTTTLTKDGTPLALPDDLIWTDEFAWRPVQSAMRWSIAGALLVDSGTRLAGRPITLAGGDGFGWLSRAALDTLETWKGIAGQALVLNYRGADHAVVFDHEAGAIDARPVIDYPAYLPGDYYVATLRFLKV